MQPGDALALSAEDCVVDASSVTELLCCVRAGMCEAVKMDLYAVLGASPSYSVQQLRHRYQQLALQVNAPHNYYYQLVFL